MRGEALAVFSIRVSLVGDPLQRGKELRAGKAGAGPGREERKRTRVSTKLAVDSKAHAVST